MGVTSRYVIDPKSETWLAIVEWAEQRKAFRRQVNDTIGLPPDETENQRGAIEELTLLIQQGEIQTLTSVQESVSADGRY